MSYCKNNNKIQFSISRDDFSPKSEIEIDYIKPLFFQLSLLFVSKYYSDIKEIKRLISAVQTSLDNYSRDYACNIVGKTESHNLAVSAVGIQALGKNNVRGKLSSDGTELILELTVPARHEDDQ